MTSVKTRYSETLDVDHFEPKHMGYLLGRLSARMRHDLSQAAADLGLAGKHDPLTGSYFRLASLIPEGGARVTDLARVSGMTKQALGQFVDVLEEHGYVVSTAVEGDRRVRMIARTRAGDEMVEDTERLYTAMERTWQRQVGARRWKEFREVFIELVVGGE